jgi:hypothetical protein
MADGNFCGLSVKIIPMRRCQALARSAPCITVAATQRFCSHRSLIFSSGKTISMLPEMGP